jgi:NADPH:quinone reductase
MCSVSTADAAVDCGLAQAAVGEMAYGSRVRAIVYSRHGDPDVLTLVDRPVVDPGPGEVRVRIARSGVNPTDWKSRRGASASLAATIDPPQVPGQDGAGVIDAVGKGVDVARLGERVWLWEAAWQRVQGTAQDSAVIPEVQAVPLPASSSFDLGAALGIPFLTAHRCLTVTEGGPDRLGPGTLHRRTVLVAGGAGAVGNAAIQLARWSDATVIATVSGPGKALLAAAAGADHVIDYRREDAAAEVRRIAPHGVHTIVEVAAAANAGLDVSVIGRHGAVACYAEGEAALSLPVRPLMAPNARWQFVLIYTAPVDAKGRAVDSITAAVAEGAIRVGEDAGLPLHHFPLEDAAAAHQAVEDGMVGKVILDVQ